MKRILLFLSVLLSLIWLAPAAQAMPGGTSGSFERGDANKDGFLAWEEFNLAFPTLKREAFNVIDADKDGRISKKEWDSFRVDHGKAGNEQSKGAPGSAIPALPLLNAPGGTSGGMPGGIPGDKPGSMPGGTPAAQAAPAAQVQSKTAPGAETGALPLLNAPAGAPADTPAAQAPASEKTAPLPLLKTPAAQAVPAAQGTPAK